MGLKSVFGIFLLSLTFSSLVLAEGFTVKVFEYFPGKVGVSSVLGTSASYGDFDERKDQYRLFEFLSYSQWDGQIILDHEDQQKWFKKSPFQLQLHATDHNIRVIQTLNR